MKIETFRDPQTGFEESVAHPGLWCLLFGSIYFAIKGVWSHAVVSLILACGTATLSWFIYPFFARRILERHYQRKGWIPVDASGRSYGGIGKCPFCAEPVKAEAILCKHCGSQLQSSLPSDTVRGEEGNLQTIGAGQDPPSIRRTRIIIALAVLAITTGLIFTYWRLFETSQTLQSAAPELLLLGFLLELVLLALACWLSRIRPGVFELGVLVAWFAIVTVAGHLPLDAPGRSDADHPHGTTSSPSYRATPEARRPR